MKKQATSATFIASDFIAKVGKRANNNERCLGVWSRGFRNNSGSKLIDFCEERNLIVANSCFQHPAKHITTWSQQRTDPGTSTVNTIFNQIDYIICDQKHKHLLTDARSYSGTETHSDHRLVVTRIEVNWSKMYLKKPTVQKEKIIDTEKLINDTDTQMQYQTHITESIDAIGNSQPEQHRWDTMKKIIHKAAQENIGYRQPQSNVQIRDRLLENMSIQQKEAWMKIENCKDVNQIKIMKRERKTILREMKRRMKDLKEKQIEKIIREVETTKDDAMMFKAVKELKKKDQGIKFVHDNSVKCVKQPQEIYKVVEKHFKEHFQKPDMQKIHKFNCTPRKMNKEITPNEVKNAAKQMANSKAPGKDNIQAELIKYAPAILHEEISNILNNIFRNNDESIKIGTGILIPLPKPNKPKGPTKNIRPITLLEVIRKLLSKIFMNRTEKKLENYLSKNQSAYRKGRSTTDLVWAHR